MAPLGAFLFAAACGDGPPAPERGATAPSGAHEARATAEPALPAPGESRVWIHAGEVTVLANGAPRILVLRGLAREAAFGVEIHAGARPYHDDCVRARPPDPHRHWSHHSE